MTSEAFKRIEQGLIEALAFAQGEREGYVIHEVTVPDPEVPAIRAQTGMSQA